LVLGFSMPLGTSTRQTRLSRYNRGEQAYGGLNFQSL